MIGKHDGPVKHVCWCQDMGMCISGSWDKTIRFWNGQTATAQCTLQLPERVYAMDVNYPVMVVGTAERKLLVYDLSNIQNNQRPIHEGATALKMQTRCLKVFPDKTGRTRGSFFSLQFMVEEQDDDFLISVPQMRKNLANLGGWSCWGHIGVSAWLLGQRPCRLSEKSSRQDPPEQPPFVLNKRAAVPYCPHGHGGDTEGTEVLVASPALCPEPATPRGFLTAVGRVAPQVRG